MKLKRKAKEVPVSHLTARRAHQDEAFNEYDDRLRNMLQGNPEEPVFQDVELIRPNYFGLVILVVIFIGLTSAGGWWWTHRNTEIPLVNQFRDYGERRGDQDARSGERRPEDVDDFPTAIAYMNIVPLVDGRPDPVALKLNVVALRATEGTQKIYVDAWVKGYKVAFKRVVDSRKGTRSN